MRIFVAIFKKCWVWFSTLVTILGLPSLVADLNAWQELFAIVGKWLAAIQFPPSLIEFVLAVYRFYDGIVEALMSWMPEAMRHGAAIVVVVFGPTVAATLWNVFVVGSLRQKGRVAYWRVAGEVGLSTEAASVVRSLYARAEGPSVAAFHREISRAAHANSTTIQRGDISAIRKELQRISESVRSIDALHGALSNEGAGATSAGGITLRPLPLTLPVIRFYVLTFFISTFAAVEYFWFARAFSEPFLWSIILCGMFVVTAVLEAKRIAPVGPAVMVTFIAGLMTIAFSLMSERTEGFVLFVAEVLILMLICFIPLQASKYHGRGSD